MPQGQIKVKTKKPETKKSQKKNKGLAFTRRSNAPIQPKKLKYQEAQKIKQMVSKSVNKSVEEEMRARSQEGPRNYSQAQKAVAQHHQNMPLNTSETTTVSNN